MQGKTKRKNIERKVVRDEKEEKLKNSGVRRENLKEKIARGR